MCVNQYSLEKPMPASEPPAIYLVQPRTEVFATLSSDVVLAAPLGTSLESILLYAQQQRHISPQEELIAAIVDGELRELTYPLYRDATVSPVYLNSSDGTRIYRRSLVLLMLAAIEEVLPDARVRVEYAVPDGGYYCTLVGGVQLTLEQLRTIEGHMRDIVAADEPIVRRSLSVDDFRAIFELRQDRSKTRLLRDRQHTDLRIYALRGRADHAYGYVVPSTRYLPTFRLVEDAPGFVLQFPREDTGELCPLSPHDKLRSVFQKTDLWLQRLGVEDIGQLNEVVDNHRFQELVLVSEALHEQHIADIAQAISDANAQRGVRLVMIAGPSSSGKTTFAKRLSIQLQAHGLQPLAVEMDNYFVDREATPRDETGAFDFESIRALRLDRFNADMHLLLQGKAVQIPRFDFRSGRSTEGGVLKLGARQILIAEGIHGLNPGLIDTVSSDQVMRIYVSALTQLNIDSQNRIPTTDVRLIRRIVRDARTRGYSATDTIERWPSVRRGEKNSIFPYQENADMMFNSALVYELAVLRPMVEPLLLQVVPHTRPHIEVKRLLGFLKWVRSVDPARLGDIPDTSILREFIGGSTLDRYQPHRFVTDPSD
jgi:uridine kinase